MKIGIIGGAGHIGLPMSLLLAKKHKVTIIDPSPNIVKIKKGISPFFEVGMDFLIKFANCLVVLMEVVDLSRTIFLAILLEKISSPNS